MMPNFVTINGVQYGARDAAAASRFLLELVDTIHQAQIKGKPQLHIQRSDANGEPTHTIVVITPSTQVSAVVDRMEGEQITQQWDTLIDDQSAARAKRRAELEAEWAAEDAASQEASGE